MLLHPFSKKINRIYRDLSKSLHNKDFHNKINGLLKENGGLYEIDGKISVPKFYSEPFFFGNEVSNYLQNLIDRTDNLLDEVFSILVKGGNPHLKFLGIERQHIDIYKPKNPAQIFRVDGTILKKTKKLKFMEINTNNPGGLFNSDKLENILLEHDPVLQEMKKDYDFRLYNRIDSQINSMISYFENFQKITENDLGRTFLILGDKFESDIPYKQLKSVLEQKGLEVIITSPDDDNLVYNGKGVSYQGKKIGFVNRRIESKDLMNQAKFLINASKERKICVYNPFSSSSLGVKKLYILLHNLDFQKMLSQNSIDFINDHIPVTYDFLDFLKNNFEGLKHSKNSYVIKSNAGEKGNGVIIGPETTEFDWLKKLNWMKKHSKRLKSGRHIIQEYLPSTKVDGLPYDYNLLSINGIFFPFGRVAKNNFSKTNIAQGGAYVPCFRFVEK